MDSQGGHHGHFLMGRLITEKLDEIFCLFVFGGWGVVFLLGWFVLLNFFVYLVFFFLFG